MINITVSDLNKKTYCALELAIVEEFTDLNKFEIISLDKCAIVEVAAAKVVEGKIQGHFHSFVAIEGYDAHDIEIETSAFVSYSINGAHLIGAPNLDCVIKSLHEYVGDSTVLVNNNLHSDLFNPLYILRKRAQEIGCSFEEKFIRLKDIFDDDDKERNVQDIFRDYDVNFAPFIDSFSRSRNDTLSWALAYAQLLINVVTQK